MPNSTVSPARPVRAANLEPLMRIARELHVGTHAEPAVIASIHRIGDTVVVTWTVGFDSYYHADQDVPVVDEDAPVAAEAVR